MRAIRLILIVLVVSVCPMVAAQSAAELPEGAGDDWFTHVQKGIRDGEYRFQLGPASYRPGWGEVWQAPNRALDLRLYFDARGFEILERTGEGAPTIARLALAGWGRPDAMDTSTPGALREVDGRMERLHGSMTEGYTNSTAGLEVAWDLTARPRGDGPLVLEFELDHATARARAGGVEIVSETGRRLLLQAPSAADRDGDALPVEWVIVRRDRLELRVTDDDASYPLKINSLLTATADAVLASNQSSAEMGWSVSTAGDVNGDGFADVIVGAHLYDHGQADEGAALVFLGSASGIVGSSPADAHALIESDQADARLGRSVSTAGDVNGDGFADIIVGAWYYSHGEPEEGVALVFLGSAAGVVGSSPANAHAFIESDQAGARFGASASTAGDVNGDGFADVIVGAFGYDNPADNEGAAFVFLGSAAGIVGSSPATAHAVIDSNQYVAWLGNSVSTAGDVNGDGFADIIVGAPRYDHGETNEGAAFVFLGSAAGIVGSNPANAHAMLESDQADALLGGSVSTAGDVNGDGFADVIVGAYFFTNGEYREGTALVFLGSAAGIVGSNPADAHALLESDQDEAHLGISVSTAGDVNGDGFADIIAGAYGFNNGHINEGAALVFFGSSAGIVGSSPADAGMVIESDQHSAWLGNSVSTAGDINGDGFADVIVGAYRYNDGQSDEGAAFVYLGSATSVVGSSPADAHAVIESDENSQFFGFSVSTAGDVNGDGFADVIVGAFLFSSGQFAEGAAMVFLGSAEGIVASSPADAQAVIESNQEGAELGWSVSTAGDVNGDGFSDIIVGAPEYDHGEDNEGAAFVFLGSAQGIVGSSPADAHAMIESNAPFANLGYSVSSAGDVNGDGFADVIAGAENYVITGGIYPSGAALVFLGSASGIVGSSPADAHALIESDEYGRFFGYPVSTAGDVNGDGYSDIIVGDWFYSDGLYEEDEGAAFVFLGSAIGIVASSIADAHAMIESNQREAHLGARVSTAGDVNGDGFADIIVGAPDYDMAFPDSDEGAAFVFLGSAAGIVGSSPADADAVLTSDQSGADLGRGISSAGDVNGDGFSDVIVGANLYVNRAHYEGAAIVFLGNSEGRPAPAQQLAGSGDQPIQPWAISDSEDSFTVRMRASSPRGREQVRLELETCPSGSPFGSFECSTRLSSGWADSTATAGGVELEVTADGLEPGELYRWRVRTLYLPYTTDQPGVSPPPIPSHGPWRRLGAQAEEADIRVGYVEEPPLFADDFESGDTSAWSAAVL